MTRENPDYPDYPDCQEFCRQIHRRSPTCEGIDKSNINPSLSFFNTPNEPGLVLRILELGGLFVGKKIAKFYAQGT